MSGRFYWLLLLMMMLVVWAEGLGGRCRSLRARLGFSFFIIWSAAVQVILPSYYC